MLGYVVFAVCTFIFPLILHPIGVLIYNKNINISTLFSIVTGVGSFFLTIQILEYFDLITEYNWIHFVIGFFVIGAMNNGNLKKDTPQSSKSVTTFIFGGFVITSIIYLFI